MDGYRRGIEQARAEVPQIAGRSIEPFGLTEKEAKVLVSGSAGLSSGDRPALGDSVRRWTNSGGATSQKPSRKNLKPTHERLAASAVRLEDADLEALYEAVRAERARRRKRAR